MFLKKNKRKLKIGLVLGSGSAKGIAHIGVLKVLEQLKIKPDIITGTSIGSLIGGMYASGYLAKDIEDIANTIDKDELKKIFKITFDGAGLVNGEILNKYLDSILPISTFENLKIKFGCVACNIIDGREFHFTKGFLRDAIRASISIPGILTPKKINDLAFVDGGLVNPVPVSLSRRLGADIIIAVNVLNVPILKSKSLDFPNENIEEDRIKSNESINEKIKNFLKQEIKIVESKTRVVGTLLNLNEQLNIIDILSQTFLIAESNLAKFRLGIDKPDFLIQPDMSSIRHFDFYRSKEAILLGEKEMWRFVAEKKLLERIKNYEKDRRFLQ